MCDSPTGHSGRDGQPSVHSCGDTLEVLLEVQPEQWDRITQPVSVTNTLSTVWWKQYIPSIAVTEYLRSPPGTMSRRSVCPSRAWWCCASLSPCCAGRKSATTYSTRLWWRCSSLMCWDPSRVSNCLVSHSRLIDRLKAYQPEKVREHWPFSLVTSSGVWLSATHLHVLNASANPFSLFLLSTPPPPPPLTPQVP